MCESAPSRVKAIRIAGSYISSGASTLTAIGGEARSRRAVKRSARARRASARNVPDRRTRIAERLAHARLSRHEIASEPHMLAWQKLHLWPSGLHVSRPMSNSKIGWRLVAAESDIQAPRRISFHSYKLKAPTRNGRPVYVLHMFRLPTGRSVFRSTRDTMMMNVVRDGSMMSAPRPWSALGHGRDAWRGDRVVPCCRRSAPRRVQAAAPAGVAALPARHP